MTLSDETMSARGAPSARTRLTLITYSTAWSTRDTASVISAGTTAAAAPPPPICPGAGIFTSFSDDAAVAASASVSRRLGLADVRRAGAGGAEGAAPKIDLIITVILTLILTRLERKC